MAKFYSRNDDKIILQLYLQPGAKCNEIVGMHGDYLKIKVKAPPVEGKANEALIKFLVIKFGVERRDIILAKGEKSRYKQVIICNLTELPAWFLNIVMSEDMTNVHNN